jgi:type VI protein secretion system component Hcp
MNKRLFPEYRGFEFWICKLDNAGATDNYYGYQLREVAPCRYSACHHEGGGAYTSKHEATKAAFARIETLTFDR